MTARVIFDAIMVDDRPDEEAPGPVLRNRGGAKTGAKWILDLPLSDRISVGKDIQKSNLAGRLECPPAVR